MFILDFYESDFPRMLREIKDPPRRLYYQGDLSCIERPCVAIVGTRHATPRGLALAHHWAKIMGERGLTVVSGLAYGIDTAAHEGALAGGGATVAVLAHGIEDIEPKGNLKLAERIVDSGGLVLSEHNGEGRVFAKDYLVRNRIIAGLCASTVVIEAPYKSGALNTASHANENGRNVWCVPGRITDEASQGCLKRIQDGGAGLALRIEDILEQYDFEFPKISGVGRKLQLADSLSEQIQSRLHEQRATIHDLTAEFGDQHSNLLRTLFELELSGQIVKGLDGFYSAPP